MDFEKICMMFTMQEPYYGIILSSMVRTPVPASRCQTMGVTRSGNVFKLIYNKEFVDTLDIDTTIECLRHEILHLAFNHFTLWEPTTSQDEQTIRNYAADLEVNCYLNLGKVRGMDLVTVDKFGWAPRLGAREYYRLLMDAMNQQKQKNRASQNVQKPCNGGQGGQSGQSGQSKQQGQQSDGGQGQPGNSQQQSQPQQQGQDEQQPSGGNTISKQFIDDLKSKGQDIDDHSNWPDNMDESEKSLLDQQIEDMLVFAADEVEKSQGTVPGELAGKIKLIRDRKKPKPVADWKRYVRRYLGNEFSEFIRKSKKRESRRFPDAAGNRHRRKSHILVAIDTSGSVSMPEYREFFGQIRTLTAVASFHVVECDARIQHEYDYKGKPNELLHGGGGTSFEPVIDMYIKNQRIYDALIYFTDGECGIPRNTPKDTLWVVSSKGDQSDRKRYQVNGASVAFIPKQN